MKRPGESLLGKPDEFRFVGGKPDADVEFVGWHDVGALLAGVADGRQEIVEPAGEIETGDDVDVGQEHPVGLAIFSRQISHVILRIDVPSPPAGLLVRNAAGKFVEGRFRFGAVEAVREFEDPGLLLRRPVPRHRQREADALTNGRVASPKVDDVALKSLELLVASGVEGDRDGAGPVMCDLDDRVELLQGGLRGEADLARSRDVRVVRADEDRVEAPEEPPRVPTAELDVEPHDVVILARLVVLGRALLLRLVLTLLLLLLVLLLQRVQTPVRHHARLDLLRDALRGAGLRLKEQKGQQHVRQRENYHADQTEIPWPTSQLEREKNFLLSS